MMLLCKRRKTLAMLFCLKSLREPPVFSVCTSLADKAEHAFACKRPNPRFKRYFGAKGTIMAISSEQEWAERAAAFLKHKLRECEVTYVELAKRLRRHGFKDETEASITNKLARGTFPVTFFLAWLATLELDGVALEEI
jgi:hypothetical protein